MFRIALLITTVCGLLGCSDTAEIADAGAYDSAAVDMTATDGTAQQDTSTAVMPEASLGDSASIDDGSSATGQPSPDYVDCVDTSCANGSEVCCVAGADGGGAHVFSCIATGDTCSGESVACDEPGDCATDQVCCRPTGGTAAVCSAAADCSDSSARLRCHVDSDCPTELPACCESRATMGGGSCKASCTSGGPPSRDASVPDSLL